MSLMSKNQIDEKYCFMVTKRPKIERKFCNISTIYIMSCLNENIVWYGKAEMFMGLSD